MRRLRDITVGAATLGLVLGSLSGLVGAEPAAADDPGGFTPGAAGVGDRYFPTDGNGGYDVEHYGLDLRYEPARKRLEGSATIDARATQNLSRFNLDLDGLTVRSVDVNGADATWSRAKGELTVTPSSGLVSGLPFTVVVRYDGVPVDATSGLADKTGGIYPTRNGAMFMGEPHGVATWFPANDHPDDRAGFDFRITVPEGLTAVANGALEGTTTSDGWSTFTWRARSPMAPYLAMAAIGTFDLRAYERDGIRFWDAIDTGLFHRFAPRTGERFAFSGRAQSSYKRLARTISVPEAGAKLSFSVDRNTEGRWDFVFVEARPRGTDAWTTLRDLNGHTSRKTGSACPYWHELHPFLTHYQKATGKEKCAPRGTTGRWWAASGTSFGFQRWSVDLSRYAGRDVEVSISYAGDDLYQGSGVVVDDIAVSGAAGSTSFEADGDPRDGWRSAPPPPGSKRTKTWRLAGAADAPRPIGETARRSLGRQADMMRFLAGLLGPYPWSEAGAVVHAADAGFALENQTRSTYSFGTFGSLADGNSTVLHEITHQWFGDSLTVADWRHIWLNEGFASYGVWLWDEHEGTKTADAAFAEAWAEHPADEDFWKLKIGAPGPDHLFDGPVYDRGAMTLHQLRRTIGDGDFFHLLKEWATSRAGTSVTTAEFIALAEEVSGEDLGDFFDAWLFTGKRPAVAKANGPVARGGRGGDGGSGDNPGAGGDGGDGVVGPRP